MSVLSSKALQEQLSDILGALTKAALAEICELVEEGYSVLQLEISRSHKENQDLRKKLHLIESIVVRGGSGGGGESQAAAPEETEAAVRPETPHRPRDRERADAAAGSGVDGGPAGVEREEVPDVVLIKDEDSDGYDSIEDGERKPHGGGALEATRTVRRRRRRSRAYEDAETSALKTPKLAAPSQKNVPVYSLDSPRSEPSCSAQLLEDVQMKVDDSDCSYPEVQLVQECSLVSPGPSRQVFFSSSALMEAQSPANRPDLNLDPAWTKQPKGSITFAQFCPNENLEGDAFGLKLVGISGSTSADDGAAFEYENDGNVLNFGLYGDPPGPAQLPAGDPDDDPQRKRFVCSICNKTYATAQNLEVHTRIHTGERPFACDQCGKKFTQSAHLRSHLNVHTGERPYGCTLCSRSFIVKYSLKLHMRKCHPNN